MAESMMMKKQNVIARMGKTRLILGVAALALIAVAFVNWSGSPAPKAAPRATNEVTATTAKAERKDMPIYLQGLGTVQAFYTATVTSRVDGELQKVAFTEGQAVKKGDLLAQIDPRPYQAAYDQAVATKNKDIAQLANARIDQQRYAELAPQDLASKQQVDTQKSLVAQLEAQVAGDQAAIDNAKTQLDYAHITSPIDGLTGVRQVDPGNNLHGANATPIVVVTQIQPISVIFTLPEESLGRIAPALKQGAVQVVAMSRDGKGEIDRGQIAVLDNQIDQTTGTVRLKATFPNADSQLWPGEYVDARILLKTSQNAVAIPDSAVQRGPKGLYAFLVKDDQSVEMRPIKIGPSANGLTIVEGGLEAGDTVTTNNEYRLREGVKVKAPAPANPDADKKPTK
jgi:multidrug efflux system membrane fusion protein